MKHGITQRLFFSILGAAVLAILSLIYPDDRFVNDRTIDSHIKKLRRKIQVVDSRAELIHSVYGVGYKFEPVSENGEPEK